MQSNSKSIDSSRRKLLGGIAGAIVAASAPQAALGLAAQASGQAGPGGESAPDRDEVAALLKQLFSSNDPAIGQLLIDAYADCVLGKIRAPDPPLAHSWIVPGGGYYAQWLWDTMFVADLLSILPGQEETIRGVFQNYWDFQERWNKVKPPFMHGMVANFMAPFDAPAVRPGKDWETFPAYSQAPLLAWGMERVYERNHDTELLRAGLQPLEDFHEWYWRERDVTGCGLIGVGAYSGDPQHARYETYDHEVDLDNLHLTPHPGRAAGPENGAWYGDILIPANTAYYGVALRSEPREVSGGWQVEIECPWSEEHSNETRRDTVVSFIAGLGNGFKCFHSHCVQRHWRELRDELERRNPGLAPFFGKLPPMTHSDIARAFVELRDGFVRIYDLENATGVWIPGKRWALGDPGDALLRMAIRRYLDELHDRYSPPEPGQRDARRALKQAAFVSGVLCEVKPWLPPKSSRDFDVDPAILPLPDGTVADLRTGVIREMRREDSQTKRILVSPADVATPRWDRFLCEITCGDDELATYIERLMALAITGLALHLLIVFYGRGRNGKGVLLRLLEKMLGGDLFAASLRPDDVEYRKGSDDRNKRLMGRLRGKRLAYTGETVSGNLDWTLLKTLTGGDTLAGADLYKNTEGFQPSHTLVLTTNDRPKLPATVAFKERLRFVPFRGDFSRSKDFTLEEDLASERPGILWRLIEIAPAVFAKGDMPPVAVRDATDDVMDENDVARPFIEACLVDDPDAVTPLADIESAARQWIGGIVLQGDVPLDRIIQGVKAKWDHGRKRIAGKANPVRGLLGVRLVSS